MLSDNNNKRGFARDPAFVPSDKERAEDEQWEFAGEDGLQPIWLEGSLS